MPISNPVLQKERTQTKVKVQCLRFTIPIPETCPVRNVMKNTNWSGIGALFPCCGVSYLWNFKKMDIWRKRMLLSVWHWIAKLLQKQTKKQLPSTIDWNWRGWFYLTSLNAKCNLDKICVHMEFVLVREDPKDRSGIHICSLKEDRNTRRNLQNDNFHETVLHFSQKEWQDLCLFPWDMNGCLPHQTIDSSWMEKFVTRG